MLSNEVQLPLIIVDTFISLKMSTIKRESTITREMHAKIEIWSAQSIPYNKRIHYYERRLYTYVLGSVSSGPTLVGVQWVLQHPHCLKQWVLAPTLFCKYLGIFGWHCGKLAE